jgi:hypothetical protein
MASNSSIGNYVSWTGGWYENKQFGYELIFKNIT